MCGVREQERIRRQERKNRDAFRQLLVVCAEDGSLTHRSHWKDFMAKVKDKEEYLEVTKNTSGSTPKEMFHDHVEELEKKYQEAKTKVKDVMKDNKLAVAPSMEYEAFAESLRQASASTVEEVGPSTLKLVFDSLMEKAKEREEKEAKKKKRMVEDLHSTLKKKGCTVSSTWEQMKPLIVDSSSYKAFADEEETRKAFDEYLVALQEKSERKAREEAERRASKGHEEGEGHNGAATKDPASASAPKDGDNWNGVGDGDAQGMDTDRRHGAEEGDEGKKDKDRRSSKDKDKDKDKDKGHRSSQHASGSKKSRKHGDGEDGSDGDDDKSKKRHKSSRSSKDKDKDKERERERDKERDRERDSKRIKGDKAGKEGAPEAVEARVADVGRSRHSP
eukprot:jgi/Mesvir1/25334/Mv18039-RA.1